MTVLSGKMCYETDIKNRNLGPGWYGSVSRVSSYAPKGSKSEHMSRLQVQSPVQVHWGRNQLMFSLPLSQINKTVKKINIYIFRIATQSFKIYFTMEFYPAFKKEIESTFCKIFQNGEKRLLLHSFYEATINLKSKPKILQDIYKQNIF